MGIKARLEERERIRAKKQHKVKSLLKTMKINLEEAKLAKLPTVPFMEAALILITDLTKAELP